MGNHPYGNVWFTWATPFGVTSGKDRLYQSVYKLAKFVVDLSFSAGLRSHIAFGAKFLDFSLHVYPTLRRSAFAMVVAYLKSAGLRPKAGDPLPTHAGQAPEPARLSGCVRRGHRSMDCSAGDGAYANSRPFRTGGLALTATGHAVILRPAPFPVRAGSGSCNPRAPAGRHGGKGCGPERR